MRFYVFSKYGEAFALQLSTFRSLQFTAKRRFTMLSWTLTFLVVALIAGVLGFAGIAGIATSIAKVTFVIFIALFLLSFLLGRRTAR
jgi:uncharacterized membrane protein YtjA (UPF0391 family)